MRLLFLRGIPADDCIEQLPDLEALQYGFGNCSWFVGADRLGNTQAPQFMQNVLYIVKKPGFVRSAFCVEFLESCTQSVDLPRAWRFATCSPSSLDKSLDSSSNHCPDPLHAVRLESALEQQRVERVCNIRSGINESAIQVPDHGPRKSGRGTDSTAAERESLLGHRPSIHAFIQPGASGASIGIIPCSSRSELHAAFPERGAHYQFPPSYSVGADRNVVTATSHRYRSPCPITGSSTWYPYFIPSKHRAKQARTMRWGRATLLQLQDANPSQACRQRNSVRFSRIRAMVAA